MFDFPNPFEKFSFDLDRYFDKLRSKLAREQRARIESRNPRLLQNANYLAIRAKTPATPPRANTVVGDYKTDEEPCESDEWIQEKPKMKKALKIGCLYPFLALIGISILIGIAEEIFDVEILPEETHDTVETSTPPQKDPASMTFDEIVHHFDILKKMVWDQTPEAQGVAVGDWIYIRGYHVGFIGASLTDGGTQLKWRNDVELDGSFSPFSLMSNPSQFSVAEDRIMKMLGSIKISPQVSRIASINLSYKNQIEKGESPLIWVIAKIADILPPDPRSRLPDQWGIILTDIQVGLVSE